MPKPISTDTCSFPEIREKGCVYVDKTAFFHRLATGPDSRFFLARPRRFGKSLMISTFKALFEGRRELFADLAIAKTDWVWDKYPVMHFDLSFASSSTAKDFGLKFPDIVASAIIKAGGKYDTAKMPEVNFGNAIDELSVQNQGKGVVILIDEYDDPVAQLLHNQKEANDVRNFLASFYRQMKGRTEQIRFLMITGVSKFTKMSVFSALSNLVDLSFRDDCATMLGYTEEELDTYFDEHLRAHAQRMGMEYRAYRAEFKNWFNGYRFGQDCPTTVYNPVSVGANLAYPSRFFQHYWSSTGKAAMLMNYLKREEFLSVDIDNISGLREADFDVTNIQELRTVPMLFQTGYLTIKDFNPHTGIYSLRIPDEEVRQDLASLTSSNMAGRSVDWIMSLGEKLLTEHWDDFCEGLKAFYAGLPYGPKEGKVQEFSHERVLITLLQSQGIQCLAEDRQANGQADVVGVHPCGIFLFELKVDETAVAALEQIRKKGYDKPYRADTRPIWLIGLNFDGKTRQLNDTLVEKLMRNNQ